MKMFFLFPVLIFGLICMLHVAENKEGVVYYVSPTEPLSSCPGDSSCQPGQLCHTMDHLAEHSSEFFSSDHINITLIFMCGVHNYTKDLTVTVLNLYLFVMKGATGSRENVIIDHHFGIGVGKPNCTVLQFFNVSFVNITTLMLRCPAMYLDKSLITVKTSHLYGYPGINESLSFISITGTESQAVLDNCRFKENCFVMSFFGDRIIVSNSIFQSYRQRSYSIITTVSSIVIITGNVNFTDSITGIPSSILAFGTAVYLQSNSSLNITTGATVYFINLTCSRAGGAVYGWFANVHIGDKARVVFMHNTGYLDGGAVAIWGGMITIGVESCVMFMYNCAILQGGGAIVLFSGTLIVEDEANLTFSHNSANAAVGRVLE